MVQNELTLIKGHEGFADSPIFGYKEDYSQYVPRGHYTLLATPGTLMRHSLPFIRRRLQE